MKRVACSYLLPLPENMAATVAYLHTPPLNAREEG